RFRFGHFYLTPSLMVKFVQPAPVTYDINLKGQVADAFWAGLSWRHQDGVAAMAGFLISATLNVAYAYDFINSDLRRHSLGSHESILGINLNNQQGPKCPAIAWQEISYTRLSTWPCCCWPRSWLLQGVPNAVRQAPRL